jgi:hypothetical protein
VARSPYADVFPLLGVPPWIREIAAGELPLRNLIWCHDPMLWFGFPPALCPLYSKDWPFYVGAWVHPLSQRSMSFVILDVRNHHRVEEISRSSAQLGDYLIGEMLSVYDTPDRQGPVRDFADRISADFAGVDALMTDDLKKFVALPSFADAPPRQALEDDASYSGDFPSSKTADTAQRRDVCVFELNEGLEAELLVHGQGAPWLLEQNAPRLFERYLAIGAFEEAWMALNSRGWTVGSARQSLTRLAEQSGNTIVQRIAVAWSAIAKGSSPEVRCY